mgnify:CR=1 FL=1
MKALCPPEIYEKESEIKKQTNALYLFRWLSHLRRQNNLQNDELTFSFANGGDWWFHAKGAPGSHVIVKTNGDELPDRTFEEAGRLAAYYSKNRGSDKVEIDYIEKKHVKKPNGAKPGFVVYYTNYSLVIDSDISNIKVVQD